MLSDKRLKNIEKRLSSLENKVNRALCSDKDDDQWQRAKDQLILKIIHNKPLCKIDPLTGNSIWQEPQFSEEKYQLLRDLYDHHIKPGQVIELAPNSISTEHTASPIYFWIDDIVANKYTAIGVLNTNKTISSYSLLSLEFKINDLMNDEYVFAHVYNNMDEFSHFHHDNIQPASSVLDAENIRKDSASSFVLSWRIASLAVGDYVTLACDDTVYYLHVCQDKMDFYHLIEIFTHEDLATNDKIEGLCGRLISNLKPTKQIVLVAWGHSIEEMNKMSRRGNNGKD